MGWSGGTAIMRAAVTTLKKHVPKAQTRTKIYSDLLDVLRNADWDCEEEVQGLDIALDSVLNCTEEP